MGRTTGRSGHQVLLAAAQRDRRQRPRHLLMRAEGMDVYVVARLAPVAGTCQHVASP